LERVYTEWLRLIEAVEPRADVPGLPGTLAGGAGQVTGNLAVQPGQLLLISVGQGGANAGSSEHDPQGGWGGLGATRGGAGSSATS
jgi:hypothetical protein